MPGKLILLGDFNVHWDEPTKYDVIRFSNATNSAGFIQYVHGPTHKDGHTIDLVFTHSDHSAFLKDCHTEDKLMSDHHVICFNIDLPKPKQMRVTSTVRNYRNIDHDEFCKSLTDFVSNYPSAVESDCNSMFEWYSSGMENLLESFAPSTTLTRLVKSRMPWYNETIHLARQHRRQAERKWRKSRSADDRELYLTAKNHVNDLTIKAKETYFKEKLSTCNTRDVYRIINSLLNKNVHHLPFYESACDLSNKFANYFLTKIVKIREDLDAELVIPNSQFTDSANTFTVPQLSTLRPTTEEPQ